MNNFDCFKALDIRIGTILDVSINKRAKKAAYKITADFGDEIGVKTTSAQVTNYSVESLIGKQIVGVVNFDSIRIGDVKSEFLILGSDSKEGIILLTPTDNVNNGDKIC